MPNITEWIVNEDDAELKDFQRRIVDIFSGARVNFLIGSGFSKPFLETLGDLEDIQTHLSRLSMEPADKLLLTGYLLWIYFCNCMYAMVDVQAEELVEQRRFANLMYALMNERSTPVLSKQINIFTTNYDPILELVFDANRNIAYNDGFEGRINPYFSSSNFSKLIYRQAIFSNNKVEVPVVNILKMHGSLTWDRIPETDNIGYCDYREKLHRFYEENHKTFDQEIVDTMNYILDNKENKSIPELTEDLAKAALKSTAHGRMEDFLKNYTEQLQIVNPTKEKFDTTIMNIAYHELIRIFSNELEKENSVLLVYGFSFKDEHILEITKRSIVNPTLQIYIFCYDDISAEEMMRHFQVAKNHNIFLVRMENEEFQLNRLNDILQSIIEDKGDYRAK
jgi:hypothetical protein